MLDTVIRMQKIRMNNSQTNPKETEEVTKVWKLVSSPQ